MDLTALVTTAKASKPTSQAKSEKKTAAAAKAQAKPNKQAQEIKGTLPLEQVSDRANPDTRPLDPKHVEELAESLAIVGLIQPLVVDQKGRLLAGGHRRAALLILKQTNPEAWNQHFPGDAVPVHMFSFDSAANPERALQIETTENEKRLDYTPEQVRALADRFREAGYADKRGGQAKGAKQLTPTLMEIVGKSRRTIKAYLASEDTQAPKTPAYTTARSKAIRAIEALAQHPDLKGKAWQQDRKWLKEILTELHSVGPES